MIFRAMSGKLILSTTKARTMKKVNEYMNIKTIILARVSSKEQEDGHSIPAQVRRLTDYALKKKLRVEHTFQITESSSKETRKQFDEIITLIKKSTEPIALVTDTVDRLQRSFRETPILDEMRKEGKLELHFLREGLIVNQKSNSAQLLQWDIGVLFASSYVRQLSDNVKRSKEQGHKNGDWSALAPFGYKNVTLPTGKKSLEVDPATSGFVVKMFEMYAAGNQSFATIADEMNRLGLRGAEGNPIYPSRVHFTLKNPFYYGIMRIKGEFYKHNYQPLIQESLFHKVNSLMAGHNKSPAQYAGKPILFRGVIRCQRCDCMVSGDVKKQKYVYYSCGNSKGLCKKIWVKEEKFLEAVLGYFDRIKVTDEQIEDIVAHLKKSYGHEQEFFQQSQQALRKEMDQIQGRLSKLVDMHLDGAIDPETYQAKLREYKERQREITNEMQSHVDIDESCLITAKMVLGLAQNAREWFESSNLDQKQQLLRFVFSNFSLDGQTLHLQLREPFSSMSKIEDQPIWLNTLATLRTFNWNSLQPNLKAFNICGDNRSANTVIG